MVTDFPAPPIGNLWHISANHANRELIVQLVTHAHTLVYEHRTHLHWDNDQVRHAVVDAMNAIIHGNVVRSKMNTFLKELEVEANNQ